MQKNTTSLLYALICLSVAVPMLSGCRFNGPPYRPSSWEFYSMSSKEYHAPFGPKDSSDYDDSALAKQFNDPYDLPKTNVNTPPDGYLNNKSKEIRLSANESDQKVNSNSLFDSNSALARNSDSTGSSVATAKPQAAGSLFDQTGTPSVAASTAQAHQYGTVSPIDQGFATTGTMGAMASNSPANPTVNPQVGTYSAAAQYAGPAAGQPGQQPMQGMAGTMQASNPTYNNSGPQMVASTQGTGYGQGMDYMSTPMATPPGMGTGAVTGGYPAQAAPVQGMPAQGSYVPADPTMQGYPAGQQPVQTQPGGVYYPNGQSVQPGQSGLSNPSAVYPTTDSTSAYPSSTLFPQSPVIQQQQPVQQQPVNGTYQGGFNSFAPTGDDGYRPGGSYGY